MTKFIFSSSCSPYLKMIWFMYTASLVEHVTEISSVWTSPNFWVVVLIVKIRTVTLILLIRCLDIIVMLITVFLAVLGKFPLRDTKCAWKYSCSEKSLLLAQLMLSILDCGFRYSSSFFVKSNSCLTWWKMLISVVPLGRLI